MKKDLKSEILIIARNLFNEYGYNQVTMRDIADALGISTGNLTYHYKKKENLIEAVVVDQHKKHIELQPADTLEELNQFFNTIFKHQNDNAYYFRHYTQLSQTCPAIYAIQFKKMQNLYYIMNESSLSLQKSGLIKTESFCGQMDNILQVLMATCIFGIPKVTHPNRATAEEEFLSCIWSVIYLTLTEKGCEIYHNSIKK